MSGQYSNSPLSVPTCIRTRIMPIVCSLRGQRDSPTDNNRGCFLLRFPFVATRTSGFHVCMLVPAATLPRLAVSRQSPQRDQRHGALLILHDCQDVWELGNTTCNCCTEAAGAPRWTEIRRNQMTYCTLLVRVLASLGSALCSKGHCQGSAPQLSSCWSSCGASRWRLAGNAGSPPPKFTQIPAIRDPSSQFHASNLAGCSWAIFHHWTPGLLEAVSGEPFAWNKQRESGLSLGHVKPSPFALSRAQQPGSLP